MCILQKVSNKDPSCMSQVKEMQQLSGWWMCILQKVSDKDRPDEAFTTDRAVRAGRANAASGRIMVTVPGDHFGPIPPEADPRGQVRAALPL